MPEHNKSKDVLIGIMTIAMVVIGIVVYQTGYKSSPKTGGASQTLNISPTKVHSVLGTVEQISGQEITLKDFRKSMSAVSNSASQSARIIVTVNQLTIMQRLSFKDQATIAKEMDDFIKNIQKIQAQSPSAPPSPPEPFSLVNITLGDIHVGDVLIASSVEDISALTTFTATKIEIRK